MRIDKGVVEQGVKFINLEIWINMLSHPLDQPHALLYYQNNHNLQWCEIYIVIIP